MTENRRFKIEDAKALSAAFSENLMLAVRTDAFEDVQQLIETHLLQGTKFCASFLDLWKIANDAQRASCEQFEKLASGQW